MPEVKKYRPNIGAPRTAPNEEPAAERACDFRPVDTGFTKEDAIAEANRCLDCKKPLCMQGCPVGVNIPGFIAKIREEDWGGALETIKGDNLLPSVCGRVCPQENQCEGKCILGRKGEAVAIGQLERMVGDMAEEVGRAPVCKPRNGKKVAIVGSGPSGIACAGELAREGFDVTVFEAFFTGGGVLTYGIPEFRLPKKIVKREIDGLEQLGVKFEYNSVAGRLFDAEELFNEEGFDASTSPWALACPASSRSRARTCPACTAPTSTSRAPTSCTPTTSPSTTPRSVRARTSSSSAAATWPWTPRAPLCAWAPTA